MGDASNLFVVPGVLCYVRDGTAFFTTRNLADRWGDDWNDQPYEHNAGPPYEDGDDECIYRVFFDRGALAPPCEGNSEWSVEDINKRRTPWLSTSHDAWNWDGPEIHVWAGATFEELQAGLVAAGGSILVPLTAVREAVHG